MAVMACKSRNVYPDSNLQFALGKIDKSMLKDIEAGNGTIPVCLALINFPEGERQKAEASFKDMVDRAANSWNGLLKGHPNWPVQRRVEIDFAVKESRCQSPSKGFGLTVWHRAIDFERDYCSNPGWVCSSGGSAALREIFIGPVNRGRPSNIYSYYTILHEYGHLLGLGDTYRNKGMSDWDVDQPPSVMNGENYPPEVFTTDDRWGIWATLNAVKSGRRDCRGFGKEVEMKMNSWQNIMCDPRSEPSYVHRSIEEIPDLTEKGQLENPDLPEVRFAPIETGKWKYDGRDEKNDWMVVSSVDGKSDHFRAIGFIDGESRSANGTIYKCENTTDVPFPRECIAASNENYKILLLGKKRMILKTPAIPDGIEVNWFTAKLDWNLL
ncbi:MAG: hypothetical protein EBU49_02380 [Proteobacteria bacterium]|nr:hypothetical protein [Pseudomonadota bacterium]